MSRRTKVFLSYARADASDVAKQLRDYLESSGESGWLDVKDIPAGEKWRAVIDAEIYDSDAIVLVATPKALDSEYVEEECRLARRYQKRIIPVILGVDTKSLPDWVREKDYVKFTKDLSEVGPLGKLQGALKAVWDSVEQRIRDLRLPVADDLKPMLDQLETYPKATPRPIPRPEALLFCADFVDHLNTDMGKGRALVDLWADWKEGTYVNEQWEYYGAFEKSKPLIRKILEEAFKGVQLPNVRIVPFVLVVMTAQEAADLHAQTVFAGEYAGLHSNYKAVLSFLDRAGVTDWKDRYRARPEDWQPFDVSAAGKSLAALVKDGLDARRTPSEIRRAAFIDIKTLDNRPNDLRELRESGCVVIVDTVSICHPALFAAYRRAMLDILPTTYLLKIAPFEPVPILGKGPGECVTIPWNQPADSYLFERLELQRDAHCDLAGQAWRLIRFIDERVVGMFLKNYAGVYRFVTGGGP